MQKIFYFLITLIIVLTNTSLKAHAEDDYSHKQLNLKRSTNLKTRSVNSPEQQEYERLERDFLKMKKAGGKISSSDLIGRWSVNNQVTGDNFSLDILDINTENNISSFSYRVISNGFIVSSGIGVGIGTILVFNFTYVNGSETYFLQVNKSARGFTGIGAFTAYIPSDCVDDNGDGVFDVGELYLCITLEEPYVGFGGVNMIKSF
jgi:hypothetical protein